MSHDNRFPKTNYLKTNLLKQIKKISLPSLRTVSYTHLMQRGFTSLMFCFGCTGGQHRSVYSAQHLAEHIHRKFGVEVQICHREPVSYTHLTVFRQLSRICEIF